MNALRVLATGCACVLGFQCVCLLMAGLATAAAYLITHAGGAL